MSDSSETSQKLIEENALLKQRIRDLEQTEPEYKQDEKAFHEREKLFLQGEERYRNILDNMEEAYYEIDLHGNLTFFNDTAVKNLGYSDDVMMGMNFRQYVDKDNERKLTEAYNKVFLTGKPVKGIDWEIISKVSGTIPVESSISLMRDPQGKPVGFRGIIRDITARKQAEKELRENKERLRQGEERYRSILDNMEEAYYEVDLPGNMTFFNTTAVTNLGYTGNEMMGMNYRQYVDEENKRKLFEAFTKVFTTGESVKGMDWELISKSGDKIPVESSISLMYNPQDKPEGFRGIIRDITARKIAEKNLRESEEKYRLLAENATDIIFTMNENLILTYISPSVTRLRGYTVDEALAQSPAEILTPASMETAMKAFAEELEIETNGSGDPDRIRILELELICKDSSTIWTETAFTIFRNEENKFTGFLGITRDITERRQAEQALLDSEIKFRNLTETAIDAIATIDMNGIITYANPAARSLAGKEDILGLFLKDLLPRDFKEQLAIILESIKRGLMEPFSYETKITKKRADHPLYFDIRTSTLLNQGEPSGVLLIARDTTERKRTEDEIRQMAIADTLTGLFNRRGFIHLAEQQLKTAARNNNELQLFFIDLDGLKFINDTYGHEEGDRALKKTAQILKKTFRESDITARLGGDEFAVLVADHPELAGTILKRLNNCINKENDESGLPYKISMSIGVADYNPSAPCSIQELMSRADQLMYAQKKEKKQAENSNINAR